MRREALVRPEVEGEDWGVDGVAGREEEAAGEMLAWGSHISRALKSSALVGAGRYV